MTQGYDLDELVDLLDIRQPMKAGDLLGTRQVPIPLRKALSVVVEDWADNKFRQLCAIIVGTSGYAIRGFDEITRLYEDMRNEASPIGWQEYRRSPNLSARASSTYS
jgi:hypothetical protein